MRPLAGGPGGPARRPARFSTSDVHPREKADYWRAIASEVFLELDCTPSDRAGFKASLETVSLPGIGLTTVATDRCLVRRDAGAIGRSGADDMLFSVQMSGSVRLEQGCDSVFLRPGDYHLYDGSRPYLIEVLEPGSQIVAKIGRAHLERRVGRIRSCTPAPAGARGVAFDLAARFWSMLPDRVEGMHDTLARRIADNALDLLSTAILERTPAIGASAASASGAARLVEIIEGRLSDPTLSCEGVARTAGISRRYASRLFQAHGASMRRFIMQRRLERCREAIEAAGAGSNLGEIAFGWGLVDLPHFSKSFKSRFGETPSEFRRRCLAARPGPAEDLRGTTADGRQVT